PVASCQRPPELQAAQATPIGVGNRQVFDDGLTGVPNYELPLAHRVLNGCVIVSSIWKISKNVGPSAAEKTPGIKHTTRGTSSLTGVDTASASACSLRRWRKSSACTLRTSANPAPICSACTTAEMKIENHDTATRRPSQRRDSTRGLPARLSR